MPLELETLWPDPADSRHFVTINCSATLLLRILVSETTIQLLIRRDWRLSWFFCTRRVKSVVPIDSAVLSCPTTSIVVNIVVSLSQNRTRFDPCAFGSLSLPSFWALPNDEYVHSRVILRVCMH